MTKTFLFLFSFGITVIGFMYMIIYLNLLDQGYNFTEYLSFIIKRLECMVGIIGFILMNILIYLRRDDNDLYI